MVAEVSRALSQGLRLIELYEKRGIDTKRIYIKVGAHDSVVLHSRLLVRDALVMQC